jgi:hypothetical protein
MFGRDDERVALGGYLSVDLALALARHNQRRMLCASSRGDTPRAADTNVRAASMVPPLKSRVCAVDVW